MKKTSMILGIIGGIIAIIIALFVIGSGIFFKSLPEIMENAQNLRMASRGLGLEIAGNWTIIIGVVILLNGVLGIVGGAMVKEHNTAGGIMMLTASFVALITLWSILSFVLFLIAGIFAFVKEDEY